MTTHSVTTRILTVLFISPNDEDSICLERVVKFECAVVASPTIDSAHTLLKEVMPAIVLCDTDLPAGAWREMLEYVSHLPDPPLLIVTSRVADDRLWAEALNLGAWDVLAKPFESEEVTRIISFAWRHWEDRHGIHRGRTAQRKAASAVKQMAAGAT